ncbi:STAS domain-containing protein [Metabacillus sp. GX 13764]|uniref:STAS domain-containing protein n=1 Tax=Metabacillus kandeliae TaxID=2900151 RepID=UPI001E4AF2FE|nr:STAS domain-containing protein [Metabacillus kandeliae]MCD7034016.1 STAS domain-containing protein [Metabacillus kandeliae]
METKAKALCDYLVENSERFTEDWFSYQKVRKGSDYSADAPSHIQQKIKTQNTKYVELVAAALVRTEDDMKERIREWTAQTGTDRAESNTTLNEVAWNMSMFRRVYWNFIEQFTNETTLDIKASDVFYWEKKLNPALDYVLESFIEAFMEVLMNRLHAQSMLIRELSAPVITLTNRIGLLPLIGDIDTARAVSILESTVQQSLHNQISTLILDFSGVFIVDTMVAQQIFQLIETLKLVGVECILCGIRPEVAQTSIQLGIDFSDIRTESSLKKLVQRLAIQEFQ